MRPIKQIIIHCSDTYADMDIGAKEIRDWHVNNNGWSDIAYTYVIRRNGVIEPGRDLDGDGNVEEEIGAHAYGFNATSIGICLVGGKAHPGENPVNFTAVQWSSSDWLISAMETKYPEAEVIGHCDVSPKTCPGFNVKAWRA